MFNFKKLERCFIVAEISANHGQNFNRAVSLIKRAKECGADAVKFQAYTPDSLSIDVNNKYFRISHPKWSGQTLYNLYAQTCTPYKWFKRLKKISEDLGLVFFSTAFDKASVNLLEDIDTPFHKIASFELIDLPLIMSAAKTKKPLILSTGMASIGEIKEAVVAARDAGAKEIILLKCVSNYPANPSEMNLKTIPHMKKIFGLSVGLSDHTLGVGVSVAAVALGAVMVEKHFTLSRAFKTPDSFFSIEPKELSELVENIRIAEKAIGTVHYGLTKEEKHGQVFRRSVFVVQDIKKGDDFTEHNIRSIRPAYGLSPKYFFEVIGKKARKNLKRGTPLSWQLVDRTD